MYFVSFVLTAQFVLINVVVAVLMKHLDDSNKEAKEEAEMDAEIELELAQGTLSLIRIAMQIQMAEIEQASLRSEQLSDKSSSPPHLPDDLSLDEHSAYQLLLLREDKRRPGRRTLERFLTEVSGGWEA
ncbi:hypothetical protein NHX12_031265 [Muraenolepis orangiensis]|uniref:Ion transport domain-containing protein n=1 Tax=Muraenolepis orangiensis TaxID=630683 RepID=A0A9Q0IIR4_9TELE|nr:hypothetical protein NHX12_031265 [Muraenolepis orangiensis]